MKNIFLAFIALIVVSGCNNTTTQPDVPKEEIPIDPYVFLKSQINYETRFSATSHMVFTTRIYTLKTQIDNISNEKVKKLCKSIIPNTSTHCLLVTNKSGKHEFAVREDWWESDGALSFYDKDSVIMILKAPDQRPQTAIRDVLTIAIKGKYQIRKSDTFFPFRIEGNLYVLEDSTNNIWKEYKDANYSKTVIEFFDYTK